MKIALDPYMLRDRPFGEVIETLPGCSAGNPVILLNIT